MQLGKGKWKKILDEAGDVFKSRSQVDLKDKWRNLERQGIVQAPVKAEPASGVDTSGFCILGMCPGCYWDAVVSVHITHRQDSLNIDIS